MKGVVGVTGQAYGGTSAIAGVVHLLGFPVDFGNARSNEDTLFHKVKRDPNRLKHLIDARSKEYDTWGFKVPGLTTEQLDWYKEHIPRFRCVLVIRDPVSIATHGKDPTQERIKKHALGILHKQETMVSYASEKEWIFLVSYERFCKDPKKEAPKLGSFLGVQPDEELLENIQEYVNPTLGYRSVTKFTKIG